MDNAIGVKPGIRLESWDGLMIKFVKKKPSKFI